MAIVLPKSIFLHIPKTGGEWVRKVLWDNHLEAVPLDPGRQKHAPLQWFEERGNFNRVCRFAFVRDPLAWYWSFFRYQTARDWREIPEVALSDCRAPDFGRFLNNVFSRRKPNWLSRLYENYIGHPSWAIEFVGRTERLADHLGYILTRIGERYDPDTLRSPPLNAAPPVPLPAEHRNAVRAFEPRFYERFCSRTMPQRVVPCPNES